MQTLSIYSLLPLFVALLAEGLMLATFTWIRVQKCLHAFLLIALLFSASLVFKLNLHHPYLVTYFGSWPHSFGISFVIDHFSALMILIISIITLATGYFALTDIEGTQFQAGFLPAFWFLVIGMLGAVMTGDLFNLYVWFEMMLISSFILMGLGNPEKWLMNKFKYVLTNLIGTMLFLTAIAFIYGLTGSLNMADLALYFQHPPNPALALTLILFLLVGFAVKAALFPVFSWLPASYHTTSTTASAIMGGLLSKIGVYVIIRVFTLIYPVNISLPLQVVLMTLAALTMVIGVLGAAAQYDYRRILSFHIISQIGYMILGLALATPLALAATVFFIIHNILAKSALFLTAGTAKNFTQENDIRKMGGLYRRTPWLAALFFISALALAGLPPLSGFWAKYLLIQASFNAHALFLAITALAVSIVTLYSMIKIWNYAYLHAPAHQKTMPPLSTRIRLILPIGFIVLYILFLSFSPQIFYNFCQETGVQLMTPQTYIQAVGGINS